MHKFDARSLVLFAGLTLGNSAAVLAQTAGGAVLGPTPAPALSTPSAEEARAAFERADANKDGQLSMAEARSLPGVAEQFKQADKDSNGSLSLQEFLLAIGAK